eukprot:782505-Amphidinium_carterae.1
MAHSLLISTVDGVSSHGDFVKVIIMAALVRFAGVGSESTSDSLSIVHTDTDLPSPTRDGHQCLSQDSLESLPLISIHPALGVCVAGRSAREAEKNRNQQKQRRPGWCSSTR